MIDFAQKNILQNEMILKTISKKKRNKLSEEATEKVKI
jgi:hypothetical protein